MGQRKVQPFPRQTIPCYYWTPLCSLQGSWPYQCLWYRSLGTCLYCLLELLPSWELTILSVNLFDAKKHVTRSSPLSFNQTASGIDFATCHIPWTKTTQREGADISITARDDPSCPIHMLQHHLHSNSSIPSSAKKMWLHAWRATPHSHRWDLSILNL